MYRPGRWLMAKVRFMAKAPSTDHAMCYQGTNANDTSILVISEKAKVTGTVKAGHVIINGTVIGPVESSHLLELQPKAHIQGDILYESLEMHQGATIEGALHRISSGPRVGTTAVEDKPSLKLLASGGDKK